MDWRSACWSQPKPKPADKAKGKGGKGKAGAVKVQELEQALQEERARREEAEKVHADMELQEEKWMRIGMELELEEMCRGFDTLQSLGSAQQVERSRTRYCGAVCACVSISYSTFNRSRSHLPI